MHMGGRGWWSYISHDEKQDQPEVSWALVRRVAGYGRPYVWRIAGVLATILIITLLSLIPPLLYRDLIDNALANNDAGRLNLLALGMIGVPLANGLLGVSNAILAPSSARGSSLLCVPSSSRIYSRCLCAFSQTPRPARSCRA